MARVLVGNFRGLDGKSPTIKVGRVRTVSSNQPAKVTNVGTSSEAIFDFDIPQGKDGTGGSGGGGTSNYNELENLPSINGVTLVGNKTSDDLGIDSVSANVIASNYDSSVDYLAGSYVIYKNKLYKKNKDGSSGLDIPYVIQPNVEDGFLFRRGEAYSFQWHNVAQTSMEIPVATKTLYGGYIKTKYTNKSEAEFDCYMPVYISSADFSFWCDGYGRMQTERITLRGREWYITKNLIGTDYDREVPFEGLPTSVSSGEERYIGEFATNRDAELIDFIFNIIDSAFNPVDWDEVKVMDEVKGGGGGTGDISYTTSERVVGTWINDKPLYQKTYHIADDVAISHRYTILFDGIELRNVVQCTTKDAGVNMANTFIPIFFDSSTLLSYMCSSDGIVFFDNGFGRAMGLDLTIQYTKIND